MEDQSHLSPNLNRHRYRRASLRNVLNYASGVTFDEDYRPEFGIQQKWPPPHLSETGRLIRSLKGSRLPHRAAMAVCAIDTHRIGSPCGGRRGLHELCRKRSHHTLGLEHALLRTMTARRVGRFLDRFGNLHPDYAPMRAALPWRPVSVSK